MADDGDDRDIVEQFSNRVKDATSSDGMKKLVTFMEIAGITCSDLKHSLCRALLADGGSHLGDDRWSILELAARAAMDMGEENAAKDHIRLLGERFPGSSRVRRLELLLAEKRSHYPRASEGYHQLIEQKGTDTVSAKRLIAILKAQGKTVEAMAALSQYCDGLGQGDASAWLDLADAKVVQASGTEDKGDGEAKAGCLARAVYCLEELILLQPSNAAYHIRLAEVVCSMGCAGAGGAAAAETRLRAARLNASEGVRLTGKGSAYALAALADTCYVHWCASSGVRPALAVLPCCVLNSDSAVRAARDVAKGDGFALPAGSGKAIAVSASEAAVEGRAEDLLLHDLARDALAALRKGPAADKLRRQCTLSPTVAGLTVNMEKVFPVLALESALLSAGVEARLAAQAAHMRGK